MKFKKNQDYCVSCKSNEKGIILQTDSGQGLVISDYIFSPFVFDHQVENAVLGEAILQALQNSRIVIQRSEEGADFFDLEKNQQRYENWVVSLCEKLSYKNRRTLFKNMLHCSIWLKNGQIEISPSKHVKLEAWEGISGEDVFLTLDNNPEEIGAGLRLALSRCR